MLCTWICDLVDCLDKLFTTPVSCLVCVSTYFTVQICVILNIDFVEVCASSKLTEMSPIFWFVFLGFSTKDGWTSDLHWNEKTIYQYYFSWRKYVFSSLLFLKKINLEWSILFISYFLLCFWTISCYLSTYYRPIRMKGEFFTIKGLPHCIMFGNWYSKRFICKNFQAEMLMWLGLWTFSSTIDWKLSDRIFLALNKLSRKRGAR